MPDSITLDLGQISETLRGNLSAVALVEGDIWAGGDEGAALIRLRPADHTSGTFRAEPALSLEGLLDLPKPGNKSELDLEGMAWDGKYLWLVGSHSLKRGKPKGDNPLDELAAVKPDRNRYLLARVPLVPSANGRTLPEANTTKLYAAHLAYGEFTNPLLDALREDEHLQRFLAVDLREIEEGGKAKVFDRQGIPSKDNGLDIEGLAVAPGAAGITRVFVGLRGPVLRGHAIILELACKASPPADGARAGRLKLQRFGPGGPLYRKTFLKLHGLGIRDLEVEPGTKNLLILAGPSMDLDWPVTVFRWRDALTAKPAEAPFARGPLALLTTDAPAPTEIGRDHAEAIAIWPDAADGRTLLVLHDSPGARLQGPLLRADLVRFQ